MNSDALLKPSKSTAKALAELAKAAEESNDPGTVDLFSKIVQIHEKHEWFLREILKKKDGLMA